MMSDRERWDSKYEGPLGQRENPPDPFVVHALGLIDEPGGSDSHSASPSGEQPPAALDLASGTGRHALFLAERGWRVQAWDVSPVGLGVLEKRAAARGRVVVAHSLDLLKEPFPEQAGFQLLVAVDFFDRGLFERLPELVQPGGHMIFRTFTREWPGPKPPDRFRLEVGELEKLMQADSRWNVRDLRESGGRAGVLAKRMS